MKKSELPPKIEGIRGIFRRAMSQDCPYPKCIKPVVNGKECDDCAIDGFLSKLTKAGAQVKINGKWCGLDGIPVEGE